MERLLAIPAILATCLTAAACITTTAPPVAETSSSPPPFIEAACGGCHSVEPPFLSPNPAAPSFEAIANRRGLSEETLANWLTDAHNYPEVMDFDLRSEHIDEIAGYMITLRRVDYVPDE